MIKVEPTLEIAKPRALRQRFDETLDPMAQMADEDSLDGVIKGFPVTLPQTHGQDTIINLLRNYNDQPIQSFVALRSFLYRPNSDYHAVTGLLTMSRLPSYFHTRYRHHDELTVTSSDRELPLFYTLMGEFIAKERTRPTSNHLLAQLALDRMAVDTAILLRDNCFRDGTQAIPRRELLTDADFFLTNAIHKSETADTQIAGAQLLFFASFLFHPKMWAWFNAESKRMTIQSFAFAVETYTRRAMEEGYDLFQIQQPFELSNFCSPHPLNNCVEDYRTAYTQGIANFEQKKQYVTVN